MIGMQPGRAWLALLLLYIIIPLGTLSLTQTNEKYMWLWGSILGIILIALGRWQHLEFWAAGLFIFGIMFTIDQHKKLLGTKKHISIRAVASAHGLIFSSVLAITGTLSIMARPNAFSITCEELHTAISKNIDNLFLPLRFTTDQIGNLTNSIDAFFTKSTDQLVQEQVSVRINQQLGDLETIPQTQGILASFKNMLIDAPLASKQDIDDKICNVVFSQIREWYKNPNFRLSIFLTLILFFYPLIRFAAFIVSALLSAFYHGLKKAWFIKTTQEQVIIEKWEV
jgi:hypothetical protein